jgi:hypothetical protein
MCSNHVKKFAESESCSSDSSEEEKNSRLAFPDHTEKRLQVGHRLAFPDHTEKRLQVGNSLAFPDHIEKRLQVGHWLASPNHTEREENAAGEKYSPFRKTHKRGCRWVADSLFLNNTETWLHVDDRVPFPDLTDFYK